MPIKNMFRYWTFQIFSPGTVLREKYDAFKRLLEYDRQAHDHLAVLEQMYYSREKKDFQAMVYTYGQFAVSVSKMVDELLAMCPSRYWDLKDYFKKFDFYVRFMLAPPEFEFTPPFTIGLDHGNITEAISGQKTAVLTRLNQKLHLPVPQGFVITTNAFQYFMEANGLRNTINEQLASLDIHDTALLEDTADKIQSMILDTPVPQAIESEITTALNLLKNKKGGNQEIRLALRSSAVKEDGKASFAGQYRSLLNMKEAQILHGYKQILAGKYRSSALFYRINAGIADHDTPMAVLVLEMKDAESAGVMYTREIDDPNSSHLTIHSVWGQGEVLVDGQVSPDRIRVHKENEDIETIRGAKEKERGLDPDTGTRMLVSDAKKQCRLSLERADILTLARWGADIEDHFKVPQDIEWCKDRSGRLFLLQSRPLNRPFNPSGPKSVVPPEETQFQEPDPAPLFSGGETICRGIASGRLFILETLNQLKDIPEDSIVLAAHALPQFVTGIHKMAGIIITTGSTAGHFASIAREFGVPALIGPEKGMENLIPGQPITLDAGNRKVYEGIHSIKKRTTLPTDPFSKSDFMRKLKFVINFSAELRLTDPGSPSFKPEGCRSLHDIIRFSHETAMQEMFLLGRRKGTRKKGARQFVSNLPMLFYILDAGRGDDAGLSPDSGDKKVLSTKDILSLPLATVLKGLAHPDICWEETRHFDWESYDKAVMAGGIISPDSPQFGSYAVVARTYANISLRFGYHFVIIDAICSPSPEDNYILFRFSGGGGNSQGRWLRARFIAGILKRLEFMVELKSDLIDGRLARVEQDRMTNVLETLGRLLGATKLMDMYLKNKNDLENRIEAFMNGQYDFRPHGPEREDHS